MDNQNKTGLIFKTIFINYHCQSFWFIGYYSFTFKQKVFTISFHCYHLHHSPPTDSHWPVLLTPGVGCVIGINGTEEPVYCNLWNFDTLRKYLCACFILMTENLSADIICHMY